MQDPLGLLLTPEQHNRFLGLGLSLSYIRPKENDAKTLALMLTDEIN